MITTTTTNTNIIIICNCCDLEVLTLQPGGSILEVTWSVD